MFPIKNIKQYKKEIIPRERRYIKLSKVKALPKPLMPYQIGVKPKGPVLKPKVMFVVKACGGTVALSKILKIDSRRISDWMYSDEHVPVKYAKVMSALVLDIVSAKDINKGLNDGNKPRRRKGKRKKNS